MIRSSSSEGVRCTHSGYMIAKPCTKQEIEFYESSTLHEAFQEFMPLFLGTLSSADQQGPLEIAAAQQTGAHFLPGPVEAAAAAPAKAEGEFAAPAAAKPSPVLEQHWVPSGGKKLETGLSIVLENIACGFRRPNVLDVKLGARLWADDAPPAKRTKLDAVSKETTSFNLGYRIAGMKVWTGENGGTDEGAHTNPYATKYEGSEGAKGEVIEKDGYRRYDKWYGRSFNEENVKQGFETFLAGAKVGKVDRSKLIAERLTKELKNIQEVLEAEESRMYSASVLVVYEGDPEAMEVALEEEKKIPDPNDQENDDDDDDDDDEEIGFEISEEALELVDASGNPQTAINISIDPQTMEMPTIVDDDDEEDSPKVHDLRVIDFAHARWAPGEGPDENMLMGIRNLVKIFEELAL